jgi:hypothetical protein
MTTILVRHAIVATLSALLAQSLFACLCFEPPVCDAFSNASAVFVGKVESQDPSFDVFDPTVSENIEDVIRNSPGALAKFKRLYANEFPEPSRTAVLTAGNWKEIQAAFEKFAKGQKRVTFAVEQVYKGIGEDTRTIDVWTDFSDCGKRFNNGETYVVYSSGSDTRLNTGACSRTGRLSEAGDDLVYLLVMQRGGSDVGRIWGFLSHDRREIKGPHTGDPALSPAPDLPVELRSNLGTLRARAKPDGGFVFDGLPAGDYEIDLPAEKRKGHLEPRACKSEWFYVPKGKPGK